MGGKHITLIGDLRTMSGCPAESRRAALVEGQNHLTQEVELALWAFMNQMKPTFLTIVIAVIYLSTNVAGYSQETHSKFEAALKKELLRNHQRHVPVVTVKGSEVRLTYGPELEWAKSSAHDDVARMDALDCLKADYAALKADSKHQLHDYFHVINYSMWGCDSNWTIWNPFHNCPFAIATRTLDPRRLSTVGLYVTAEISRSA
jgi:hypothetical protein